MSGSSSTPRPRAFSATTAWLLPFRGFVLAAHCGQGVSVGAEQPGAVGEGPVDVQLGDFQLCHGSVQLAEIGPGSGCHDGQLHLARSVQVLGFLGAHHVECTVRPAQAAFAVGHHGQVHVGAADPAVGPEFAQGLAVMSGCVGGQSNGFTDGRQTATSPAGGEGMLEGKLRFFVDQAAGHDEVTGNPFGALGFQGLDLVLGGAVKFLARDILVDLRGTLAVGAVGAAQVARIGNTGRAVLCTVPAELAGTGVAAVETAGCPVLAVAERLAVVAAGEPAAFAVAFAARTVTIGLLSRSP